MAIFFTVLLFVLNLASFALYGIDKRKAKKGSWRIREKTLLVFSAIAPFGALAGSKVFHHKTKKLHFEITLFVACMAHILLYGTVINMLAK